MRLLLLIECPSAQVHILRDIVKPTGAFVVTEHEQVLLDSSVLVPEPFDEQDSDRTSSAWKRARDFLAAINGAALVEIRMWMPIRLLNMMLVRPNRERLWFPITASVEIYETGDKVSATVRTREEAEGIKSSSGLALHPAADLLLASCTDQSVAKVLRLQERESDWTNLYRIWEVICDDMGSKEDIEAAGWASVDDIKAFKASANNTSVAGDDSRHGKLKSGTPKMTMNITKARHLIDQITKSWLAHKVHQ